MVDFTDPYILFYRWMRLARREEINDPDAAALATIGRAIDSPVTGDSGDLPDVRMVLVRGVDERGFVFFTHRLSAKGGQLADNPRAALCFYWKSIRRQVRVRGEVGMVAGEEADDYFRRRPRDHQINAVASRQSRRLRSRERLMEVFAEARRKHRGKLIPRPRDWVGYRLVPLEVEFWHSRRSRLHDRLLFTRRSPCGRWRRRRLFP